MWNIDVPSRFLHSLFKVVNRETGILKVYTADCAEKAQSIAEPCIDEHLCETLRKTLRYSAVKISVFST